MDSNQRVKLTGKFLTQTTQPTCPDVGAMQDKQTTRAHCSLFPTLA